MTDVRDTAAVSYLGAVPSRETCRDGQVSRRDSGELREYQPTELGRRSGEAPSRGGLSGGPLIPLCVSDTRPHCWTL
jgi:hypothetical protein